MNPMRQGSMHITTRNQCGNQVITAKYPVDLDKVLNASDSEFIAEVKGKLVDVSPGGQVLVDVYENDVSVMAQRRYRMDQLEVPEDLTTEAAVYFYDDKGRPINKRLFTARPRWCLTSKPYLCSQVKKVLLDGLNPDSVKVQMPMDVGTFIVRMPMHEVMDAHYSDGIITAKCPGVK